MADELPELWVMNGRLRAAACRCQRSRCFGHPTGNMTLVEHLDIQLTKKPKVWICAPLWMWASSTTILYVVLLTPELINIGAEHQKRGLFKNFLANVWIFKDPALIVVVLFKQIWFPGCWTNSIQCLLSVPLLIKVCNSSCCNPVNVSFFKALDTDAV